MVNISIARLRYYLGATLLVLGAATPHAYAGDAKSCIALSGGEFVNACGQGVTVSWCADGANGLYACKDDKFTSMDTIRANDHRPYAPGASEPASNVQYGACTGSFTIHNGDNLTYSCD
jgi:hypothetical protein